MSTALVTTRTLLICKPYCKGTINSLQLFFASKSAGTRPFSLATSRESKPCRSSIPNTLATQFLPVTCPRLARTSCPRTCRTLFVIAKHAARFLSLRWREKIFLRSLNVSQPRATLVAWWKQSPHKQHLFLDYFATLVMTKA